MKKLLGLAVIASLILTTFTGGMVASVAEAATTPGNLNTTRNLILQQTNEYRAQYGLPPLVLDTTINTQAQDCSTWQADNNSMAHCTPGNGYDHHYSDGYPTGWNIASENVAYGYSPETVVAGWIGSPDHRANILSPTVNRLGVGYAISDGGTPYYTQNFGAYTSTKTVPSWTGNIAASPSSTLNAADVIWVAPQHNGNSPITGYRVTATATGHPAVTATAPANATTYTLKGLKGGVTYQIRVEALNAVGASVPSPATTVTPVGVPTVVITTIDPQPRQFTLNWTTTENGIPTTGYVINTSSLGNVQLSATARTHTFTGGTPGQNISGTLTATTNKGNTEPIPFSVQLPAVAPDKATPSASVANKTSLNITWVEPVFNGGAPITTYTVNLYDGATQTNTVTVPGTQTTTTFDNLSRGTTYRYEVIATNKAGSTPSANNTSITVPYTAPTTVRNFTATLADEQQITLNWVAPTDNGGSPITQYQIDVIKNGSQTTTVTATGTTKTLTSTTIDPSSTYTFLIRAVNAYHTGNNTASNQVIVPATPTPPGAVANLNITNITSDEGFTITWATPTNNGGSAVTGYEWEIYETDNPTSGDTGTTPNTTVNIAWTKPGTDYTVRVRAENRKGWGGWANQTVKTLANAPSTPYLATPFTATNPTTGTLKVAVLDNGGDSNITYTVVVRDQTTNAEFGTYTATANGNITITGLTNGHNYTGTITATNSGGTSPQGTFLFTAPSVSEPVTGLTTSTATNSITTTWTAPTDTGTYELTGYRVVYTDNGTVVAQTEINNPNTLTTTQTLSETSTLKWGKPYTITVTPTTGVYNLAGKPATTTATVNPRVPFGVKSLASIVKPREITLTWTAPINNGGAPVTEYVVSLRNAATNAVIDTTTTTGLTATLTPANHSTNYYATVTAKNTVGTGLETKTPTFNSGNFTPSTPTLTINLTNPKTGEVNTIIGVADDGGTPITGYTFGVYNTTDKKWATPVANTPATINGFTGEHGKTYRVEVTAINAIGSSARTIKTITIPTTNPNPVTGIATTPTANGATVEWVNPVFAGGHGTTLTETVLTVIENGATVYTRTLPATTLTHTIAGLKEYTDYTVTIAVKNNDGLSSTLGTKTFTTKLNPAPVPNNPTLTVTDEATATITWDASTPVPARAAGLLRYKVSVYNTTTQENVNVINNLTTTFTTFTGLPRGANIEAQVVAYYVGHQNTTSTVATTATKQVPVAAPTAPRNVTVKWAGLTPTVTWVAPVDNGGEAVKYTATIVDKNDTVLETKTLTGLTYTFKELNPNTPYTISVVAFNTAGVSPVARTSFTTATVPPTQPRNVETTATGRTLNTTWVAPTSNGGGTVEYNVTVWETNPTTHVDTKIITARTGDLTYQYNAGVRGKTYYVTVEAVNTAGVSKTSTSNTVFIIPVAPSPARNVTVDVAEDNTSVITWEAPTDNGGSPIVRYNVVIETTTGEVVHTVLNTQNHKVNVASTVLNPNQGYVVNVQAVTAYGSSVASTSFTTRIVKPGVARNVELLVNQNTAELSYKFDPTLNNGGDKDNLAYKAVVKNSENKTVWETTTATPGETVLIGVFPRGVDYTLTVTATNTVGAGKATTTTTHINALPPAPPTGLVVEDASTTRETKTVVNWVAPTDNGGAAISKYEWTITDSNGKTVRTGTVGATTLTLTGLTPNSQYSISIKAVNSAGASQPLVGLNVIQTPIIAPEEGTITTTATSDSISFVATVNGYGGDLEETITQTVVLKRGGETVETITGTSEELTGVFNSLPHATEYTVEHTVGNSVGETSTTTVVETDPVVSNQPTKLVATITGPDTANLTWVAPTDNGGADITSYRINWSNTDGSITGHATVKTTTATVKGLPAGNTITFTVKAVNEAGESEASEPSNSITTVPGFTPTFLDGDTLLKTMPGLTKLEATITGNTVTVTVSDGLDAEWFYGVAYSEPVGLGWDFVENNRLTYTLPAGLPAGNHNVVLYDADGVVVAAAPFTITAPPTTPPTDNPPVDKTTDNEKKQNLNGTSVERTVDTGETPGSATWLLWVGVGFLIAGGVASIVMDRGRQKRKTN